MPEFAVEAVIAWEAGKDIAKTHLAIANFTGSLRLLVGLGWPMIYFVAAASRKKLSAVKLDKEHSVEIFGLFGPIVYFAFIWWKGSLTVWDAIPLSFFYFLYLWVLWKIPPIEESEEAIEDLGFVPRKLLSFRGRARVVAILSLFFGGGVLLFFTAHPFLNSMLALATSFGVSTFVFVQWVAPFLSEFPEKLSAFYWAKKVSTANVALMNMVSSNINQWSILSGLIPVIFVISAGKIQPLQFDLLQRHEIILTILQSFLGFLLLLNLELQFHEALILFVFWFVQFVMPGWREEMIWVYAIWCGIEIVKLLLRRQVPPAWVGLRETLARRFA
jgi:cation:H+ antiporter